MMHKYPTKLFAYKDLFQHFVNLDQKKKLPIRILFTGEEGIGKSTFAFHLINYLLSKNETTKYNYKINEINTNSISYNLINNTTHPNFHYIARKDGKKNIDIDQIRKMINYLNKSSFDDNKKIILIDGVEFLNASSSNSLLKSLEESNENNLFILTHNSNMNLFDTISSRCLTFKLNFNYSYNEKIISELFGESIFKQLNEDFRTLIITPKFLINHIKFAQENDLDINILSIQNIIKYIIQNKMYKKNDFIINNFQVYIELYFSKMYLKTKDYKYYDNYLKIVSENNLINKFNLDLDSFFIKFNNKYLNI